MCYNYTAQKNKGNTKTNSYEILQFKFFIHYIVECIENKITVRMIDGNQNH